MKPKMSLHGKGEVLPKWIEDSDDVMISLVKIIPKKKKKEQNVAVYIKFGVKFILITELNVEISMLRVHFVFCFFCD